MGARISIQASVKDETGQKGISEQTCTASVRGFNGAQLFSSGLQFFVNISRNALRRRYRTQAIASFVVAGLLVVSVPINYDILITANASTRSA
jgi:hypothetical protein